MTIVIPASRSTALLNSEQFEMQRKAREERDADAYDRLLVPEIAQTMEDFGNDTTENQNHREDFTSLLNAAAKKKPQMIKHELVI